MPKVSVVIPVYNTKPEYIQEAIDSVLNQTLKDIEIIVVNDGSTESETLEYLKQLPDEIKVINQENKGLGGARNTGIKNANGECIGFLDSDDWIDNNFYEYLYDILQKDNADFACGTLMTVTDGIQEALDIHKNEKHSVFLEKFNLVTNGSVCSKLFRKEMFDNIKFQEKIYYEDNPVLVWLLLNSKNVTYTNNVNYYYRIINTSICRNPNPEKQLKRTKDGLEILKQIQEIVINEPKDIQNKVINFFSFLINQEICKNNKDIRNEIKKHFGIKFLRRIMPDYNTFYENIFSLKNHSNNSHKILTIAGLKFKFRRKKHV